MHQMKGRILFDPRGIDVVRTKIKDFSQIKVKLPNDSHKIVILDESDSLTASAQQALRMIISDFSDSTRFVFACNDSSRLIEPIQSRCVMLRFSRLSDEDVFKS
jgi:replication factor C subunit 2/4